MTTAAPAKPAISTSERYLSVWVALCIVIGITLGYALPGMFGAIAGAEVARVNLVVAVLIWLMIIPMLLKIDLRALGSPRHRIGPSAPMPSLLWRGLESMTAPPPRARPVSG